MRTGTAVWGCLAIVSAYLAPAASSSEAIAPSVAEAESHAGTEGYPQFALEDSIGYRAFAKRGASNDSLSNSQSVEARGFSATSNKPSANEQKLSSRGNQPTESSLKPTHSAPISHLRSHRASHTNSETKEKMTATEPVTSQTMQSEGRASRDSAVQDSSRARYSEASANGRATNDRKSNQLYSQVSATSHTLDASTHPLSSHRVESHKTEPRSTGPKSAPPESRHEASSSTHDTSHSSQDKVRSKSSDTSQATNSVASPGRGASRSPTTESPRSAYASTFSHETDATSKAFPSQGSSPQSHGASTTDEPTLTRSQSAKAASDQSLIASSRSRDMGAASKDAGHTDSRTVQGSSSGVMSKDSSSTPEPSIASISSPKRDENTQASTLRPSEMSRAHSQNIASGVNRKSSVSSNERESPSKEADYKLSTESKFSSEHIVTRGSRSAQRRSFTSATNDAVSRRENSQARSLSDNTFESLIPTRSWSTASTSAHNFASASIRRETLSKGADREQSRSSELSNHQGSATTASQAAVSPFTSSRQFSPSAGRLHSLNQKSSGERSTREDMSTRLRRDTSSNTLNSVPGSKTIDGPSQNPRSTTNEAPAMSSQAATTTGPSQFLPSFANSTSEAFVTSSISRADSTTHEHPQPRSSRPPRSSMAESPSSDSRPSHVGRMSTLVSNFNSAIPSQSSRALHSHRSANSGEVDAVSFRFKSDSASAQPKVPQSTTFNPSNNQSSTSLPSLDTVSSDRPQRSEITAQSRAPARVNSTQVSHHEAPTQPLTGSSKVESYPAPQPNTTSNRPPESHDINPTNTSSPRVSNSLNYMSSVPSFAPTLTAETVGVATSAGVSIGSQRRVNDTVATTRMTESARTSYPQKFSTGVISRAIVSKMSSRNGPTSKEDRVSRFSTSQIETNLVPPRSPNVTIHGVSSAIKSPDATTVPSNESTSLPPTPQSLIPTTNTALLNSSAETSTLSTHVSRSTKLVPDSTSMGTINASVPYPRSRDHGDATSYPVTSLQTRRPSAHVADNQTQSLSASTVELSQLTPIRPSNQGITTLVNGSVDAAARTAHTTSDLRERSRTWESSETYRPMGSGNRTHLPSAETRTLGISSATGSLSTADSRSSNSTEVFYPTWTTNISTASTQYIRPTYRSASRASDSSLVKESTISSHLTQVSSQTAWSIPANRSMDSNPSSWQDRKSSRIFESSQKRNFTERPASASRYESGSAEAKAATRSSESIRATSSKFANGTGIARPSLPKPSLSQFSGFASSSEAIKSPTRRIVSSVRVQVSSRSGLNTSTTGSESPIFTRPFNQSETSSQGTTLPFASASAEAYANRTTNPASFYRSSVPVNHSDIVSESTYVVNTTPMHSNRTSREQLSTPGSPTLSASRVTQAYNGSTSSIGVRSSASLNETTGIPVPPVQSRSGNHSMAATSTPLVNSSRAAHDSTDSFHHRSSSVSNSSTAQASTELMSRATSSSKTSLSHLRSTHGGSTSVLQNRTSIQVSQTLATNESTSVANVTSLVTQTRANSYRQQVWSTGVASERSSSLSRNVTHTMWTALSPSSSSSSLSTVLVNNTVTPGPVASPSFTLSSANDTSRVSTMPMPSSLTSNTTGVASSMRSQNSTVTPGPVSTSRVSTMPMPSSLPSNTSERASSSGSQNLTLIPGPMSSSLERLSSSLATTVPIQASSSVLSNNSTISLQTASQVTNSTVEVPTHSSQQSEPAHTTSNTTVVNRWDSSSEGSTTARSTPTASTMIVTGFSTLTTMEASGVEGSSTVSHHSKPSTSDSTEFQAMSSSSTESTVGVVSGTETPSKTSAGEEATFRSSTEKHTDSVRPSSKTMTSAKATSLPTSLKRTPNWSQPTWVRESAFTTTLYSTVAEPYTSTLTLVGNGTVTSVVVVMPTESLKTESSFEATDTAETTATMTKTESDASTIIVPVQASSSGKDHRTTLTTISGTIGTSRVATAPAPSQANSVSVTIYTATPSFIKPGESAESSSELKTVAQTGKDTPGKSQPETMTPTGAVTRGSSQPETVSQTGPVAQSSSPLETVSQTGSVDRGSSQLETVSQPDVVTRDSSQLGSTSQTGMPAHSSSQRETTPRTASNPDGDIGAWAGRTTLYSGSSRPSDRRSSTGTPFADNLIGTGFDSTASAPAPGTGRISQTFATGTNSEKNSPLSGSTQQEPSMPTPTRPTEPRTNKSAGEGTTSQSDHPQPSATSDHPPRSTTEERFTSDNDRASPETRTSSESSNGNSALSRSGFAAVTSSEPSASLHSPATVGALPSTTESEATTLSRSTHLDRSTPLSHSTRSPARDQGPYSGESHGSGAGTQEAKTQHVTTGYSGARLSQSPSASPTMGSQRAGAGQESSSMLNRASDLRPSLGKTAALLAVVWLL